MVKDLSSFGIAIVIDFCIFLVLFIAFLIYRKLRSKPVDISIEEIEFKEPCMNEAKYTMLEIYNMIIHLSDLEISGYLGE